jgi:hypothetical protein
LGTRAARKACDRPLQWLVDGAIPHGTVTLLAGAPTVGKSTAALDLAARLASDELPRRWLGQSIQGTPGVVAYLSGEDPEGIVNARLEALDPDDTAERLLLLTDAEGGLSGVCDRLKKLPELALLIVDPARKYLDGDEDGSASASEFFTALEQLAIRQKCAVVVIHHLTKNACPRSLEGVRAALRGSSVWTDRPRVMLAMYRHGEHTMAGVAKHNIPPQFPMMVEGCFSRDDETQRLESVGGETKTEATDGDDLDRRVLAAVARLNGEGVTIYRSGRAELWSHTPAELAGVGRNRVRQSISTLLEDGLLQKGASGIVISP